jgi:peptidoglycan hydrolase-like protein with peptidoglycan-binding domain
LLAEIPRLVIDRITRGSAASTTSDDALESDLVADLLSEIAALQTLPSEETVVTSETPSDPSLLGGGGGELCAPSQIITQNMKAGTRNGQFQSCTEAVVVEVKNLQAHMNWLGFASGPEDGILGPITDGAMKRMQEYLGTFQDGHVGPITQGRLTIHVEEISNFFY